MSNERNDPAYKDFEAKVIKKANYFNDLILEIIQKDGPEGMKENMAALQVFAEAILQTNAALLEISAILDEKETNQVH